MEPSGLTSSSPDAALASGEVCWIFGPFTVWEAQRRLERSGEVVRLGPRSFDLLVQLVKRAGELISKEELLSIVWAGVVVEDASVRVHMSLLRKALGETGEGDVCKEWITTVPLRGYRFNGSVLRELAPSSAGKKAAISASFTQLPVRLTDLVGRENVIEGVLASLETHRLVTIVGPGGIGKTSVAIRAAERWQQQSGRQVAFVDFSSLISPSHVLSTMARSLGVAADLPDSLHAITQALIGRDVLVLVDNCEHVVESLASPMARLLTASPSLRILATSRETLRVSGEYVLRLAALAVPDAQQLTLAQALRWPSIELLVERARAAGSGAFSDSDGPLLARISQQLDGIPLAIELVAAQLGVQSAGDLTLRLDNHMRVLSIDSRSALARHRTLAAALDWSIALLTEEELRLFRRLSVFRGRFDVASALGISEGSMDPDAAFDALISLANKSLVFFDSSDAVAPYRLLDTTRSYAASLLESGDERPELLRRHASLMLELMKAATAELPTLGAQEWGNRYTHLLDDVRFALKVSLTEQIDAKAAASLVTASAPLWFQLSQVAEYRHNVAAALDLLDRQPEPDIEAATWLTTSLIIALLHTDGLNPDLDAACDRALSGALAVGIRTLELQARWGRCTHDMFRGEYLAALRHSETLLMVAESWSDPAALNLAHRVSAMASHFCGRFAAAKQHCEAALHLSRDAARTRTNMVGVDPAVAAMAMLSRTLWIQGDSALALQTASDAVERAQSKGHAVSLCAALYGACPVALWSGDLERAGKWIQLMMDVATRRGLVGWLRYADWYFQGLQLHIAHDPGLHIRQVSQRFSTYDAPRKEMLATFCDEWVDDQIAARVASGEGLWCAAEVWRALARRHEQKGEMDDAERLYRRALESSREQGAKAWEWRSAVSLARMWAGLGRTEQALGLLDETNARAASADGSQTLSKVRELQRKLARGLVPASRGARKKPSRCRRERS